MFLTTHILFGKTENVLFKQFIFHIPNLTAVPVVIEERGANSSDLTDLLPSSTFLVYSTDSDKRYNRDFSAQCEFFSVCVNLINPN